MPTPRKSFFFLSHGQTDANWEPMMCVGEWEQKQKRLADVPSPLSEPNEPPGGETRLQFAGRVRAGAVGEQVTRTLERLGVR